VPKPVTPKSKLIDLLPSLAAALAALVLYLLQAPSVSGDKDSSELTLVLAMGGAVGAVDSGGSPAKGGV